MADDANEWFGRMMLLVGGAVALVIFSIVLLLGMAVVGGMLDDMAQTGEERNKTAEPNPITGEAVSFADTSGPNAVTEVYELQDSRGYGIALSGASDSYYQSGDDITLDGANWSASSWGSVDNESATMTLLDVDGEILIQYNGTTSEWGAWVYNESSRDTYFLSGNAPSPDNLTLVTVSGNSTHLTLYRNDTRLDTVTRGDSVASQWNASNWNGTVEEVRLFRDYTNSSEQSALYTDPVKPAKNRDRAARIMFDQGGGSSTPVYFAGTSATLHNARWTQAGLAGHTLTEGDDYTISQLEGTVTALSGGEIDGAPVVFIDFEYAPINSVGEVGLAIGDAFTLFATAGIIIPAIAVVAVLVGGLVGAVNYARGLDMPGIGDSGGNR